MAVDFMARQARFRNSIFIAFFLLVACSQKERIMITQKVISTDPLLRSVNGILYRSNGLFTGTVYSFYEGTKDTAEIKSFLNGKENGEWKKFYSDHSLKEKREFENGKKMGEYIAYWENGSKKLVYKFNNDEYEGICCEWNSRGVLIKQMNYKKGYEEGPQKMFYDNGKVRSNYIMIGGRRFGLLGTKNCVNVSDSVFKK